MSIVDLIATGKEAEQLVADRDALTQEVVELTQVRDAYKQQIADLQNQIDTANLQYTNDQQAIAKAETQVREDLIQIGNLRSSLADANNNLGIANVQLAQLNSVKVYDQLEFNPWAQNDTSIVGGSGLGTAAQQRADQNKGWGEFSIVPNVIAGKNNFYDCYYTKTFPADDARKNYSLSVDWQLPTASDCAVSQCLEMEIRHIVKGGLMNVIACQMDFADKQLRVYERAAGALHGHWIPTGVAQARLTPGTVYSVLLEGHRDDTTVFTNQVTINGKPTFTAGGTQYPAFDDNWAPAIKTSLQLDGMNTAFKAWYRNAIYKVW